MSQQTVKQAVLDTVSSIVKNPDTAKVVYRAEIDWEGDVKCTSRVRHFDPTLIDEPPAFGGDDSAPSPADFILTALGSCQEIMYAALASTMDIQLDSIKVKLKGNLDLRGLLGMGKDARVVPGFSNIEYEAIIQSPASQEELKRLVDAVERQCPVLDTLTRAISVSGSATINGKTGYVSSQEAA